VRKRETNTAAAEKLNIVTSSPDNYGSFYVYFDRKES
jgi:hypothetical protein